MKIYYNLLRKLFNKGGLLISLLLGALTLTAQPYLMNTNESGGPQNAGGISVYNLGASAGTAPEFYDHGIALTGEPGQYSSLIKASDGMIYGHTENGGEHGYGVFFRLNPITGEVKQLFDFAHQGYKPAYGMVEYNGSLWGTMIHSSGARIFSIDLSNPTSIRQTYDLGVHLQLSRIGGSLLLLDGKMYGSIFDGQAGSAAVSGGVYEFDPATFTSRVIGHVPYPLLYASGNLSHRNFNGDKRIVGCATQGVIGHGGFFEISIGSGSIREITRSSDKDFTGDKFSGVFRRSTGDFVSRSFYGGGDGVGTLVSIDVNGKNMAKEWTFTRSAGQPSGVLVPYGNSMIGMTIPTGGADFSGNGGNGVIYEIDRSGTYKELYYFDEKEGRWPANHFIIDGSTIYGITTFEGASDEGVLFKFNLLTNEYTKITSFGSDTGFAPQMRMAPWKDGKYFFSNRDGGVANKGTLATFNPTTGEIGHLVSTRSFNGAAYAGLANTPFLASDGKYYAIERTSTQAISSSYTDYLHLRLVSLNNDMDSIFHVAGMFRSGINEIVEYSEDMNTIGEIIEIKGHLVFTIKNKLYTYRLDNGSFYTLHDLKKKTIVNGVYELGNQFATKFTPAGNDIYYIATQWHGTEEGGTILQLDATNATNWPLTKLCDIKKFTSTTRDNDAFTHRATGRPGYGVRGGLLLLTGANSDPDTLVGALGINSPTTLGSVFKYPIGDNANVIDTQHLIHQFPSIGFDYQNNTSTNDSTGGWFPESDILLRGREIYGFTRGGTMHVYASNSDQGAEQNTPAFYGTFWSIDLDQATGSNFTLLHTKDSLTGSFPRLVNPLVVDLKPITGKKVHVDSLGCALSTKTFKVEGHKRGTLNWEYPTNVTEVTKNADSIVLDFSQIPTTVETTSTIKVWASNSSAASGYQHGDTLEWRIHQYVQPTIGNIQTSVDLHCPTKHARLTLSNYSHVDSFYWEMPSDIVLLDADSNRDNIQLDLSNEQFGTHEIICHAFNGCGNEITDTLAFTLVDPNAKPTVSVSSPSICVGDTLTFTAATSYANQKVNWTIPKTAHIINQSAVDSTVVQVAFGATGIGAYSIIAKGKSSCGISQGDTILIDVSEVPVLKSITANRSLSCSDEVLSLKADVLFGTSYNWNIPSDVSIVSGQGTDLLTLDFNNFSGDTATVVFTTQNNCNISVTDSIKVFIPHVPPVHNLTSSKTVICANTSIFTASTNDPNDPIDWTLPLGAVLVSSVSDSTIIEVDFSNVVTGNYSIVASSVSNCDVIPSASVIVNVQETPIITSLTPNRELTCNDEIISFLAESTGGTDHLWSIPEDAIVISGQGTKLLTLDMTDVLIDSVTVSITISNNCNLEDIETVKIAVPSPPTVTGIDLSKEIYHPEDTVTMTASGVTGADRYSWNIPDNAVVIGANDEQTIQYTVRSLNLGDHNVSVQAISDCGSSIATTAIIRIEYDPTSLKDELSNNIVAYPNPSRGKLSLQGISDADVSLIIRDMNGRIVQEYKGKPLDIKLNKLSNGQYMIDVFSDRQNYGMHSLIIQK